VYRPILYQKTFGRALSKRIIAQVRNDGVGEARQALHPTVYRAEALEESSLMKLRL